MLNKINLSLNVFLLIAVAYLFLKSQPVEEISDNNNTVPSAVNEQTQRRDTSAVARTSGYRLAYVSAERLNEEYKFIADQYEELEKEQMRIENQVERKLRAAENRYLELERQAPTMTQTELQDAQIELQNLQQDIAQFQEKAATDFRLKEAKAQEDFFNNISNYLEELNASDEYDFVLTYQIGGQILLANESLEITDIVIQGLNERYEASKQKPAQ